MQAKRMLRSFAAIALLIPPVPGPVIRGFEATGPYAPGQRGVLFRTEPGELVIAPVSGRVSFAGSVAGRPIVTISTTISGGVPTAGGMAAGTYKISLSPMAVPLPIVGTVVSNGQILGATAGDRLLLTVRKDGVYVDPEPLLSGRYRARLIPMEKFLGEQLQ